MEENRQTKNTVISWALFDTAFVVIILVLVVNFISKGKVAASTQAQDKLISYVSIWAGELNSQIECCKEYGEVFKNLVTERGHSLGDRETLSLARAITENEKIKHVYFCKRGTVSSSEKGMLIEPLKPDFLNSDPTKLEGVYYLTKVFDDEEPTIIVCTQINSAGDCVILQLSLEAIADEFQLSSYEDVSFLCITDKKGEILVVFGGKYRDTDSMFLTQSNLISIIGEVTSLSDSSLFRTKYSSGIGCAVSAEYFDDARMIVCSQIGKSGCFLSYGVRYSYAKKLIDNYFADTKGTMIKLVVVIVVFSIFVVSTMILASLRSRERGKVLEDKADTDLLTELNNKAATERKIQEYMATNPEGRAMMFILDIDNFKKINDTMGHAFGDTLLKTLGKEIRTEFRMTDIIGRTGGDEFIVFLKDVNDDLIVEREANRITRFFHDFKAGGDYVKYSATASIGAAIYPDDAKTFKDLYVAADQALYRAKKRGKNQLVFYNEEGPKTSE